MAFSVLPFVGLRFSSFDQVRRGLTWSDARLDYESRWLRLWRNDPRDAPVQLNWYRRITNFWRDGLWGVSPIGIPDDVASAFSQATEWRSMKGFGIVMQADGEWRAIDPSSWHPVFNPFDLNQVIGHLIAFFYNVSDPGPQPADYEDPDRIDVLMIPADGGQAVRVTFEFSGLTLGDELERSAADVQQITFFGDGVSDYVDVEPLVDEWEHRYENLRRVMDQHSDPYLQGPASATNPDGTFGVPAGGSLFLPLLDEVVKYEYLTYDGKQDIQYQALGNMLDAVNVVTGIPATAFGLGSHATQSGISRERQLFSALQKLRQLRREIERSLAQIGFSSVDWPDLPFSGWGEVAEIEKQLVEAGISTVAEARGRLGIGPEPGTPG